MGALETEEQWFQLFEAFRTGRKQAKRALRLGDGVLLESLVTALASDSKSEMLKCGLLVCLQENSVLFLEHDTRTMERVCALLSKMLETGSAGLAVQCQILCTVTSLLCELAVAGRQQRLFEGFAELLLGTVSRANGQHDAVLRATACECLRELELLYPRLLHQVVGNLAVFTQTEMSFAHASYALLLVASLGHAVQHARATRFSRFAKKGSAVTLARATPQQSQGGGVGGGGGGAVQFLLPRPMIPFSIPADIASGGTVGDELSTSLGTSASSTGSFSASSPLPSASLAVSPRPLLEQTSDWGAPMPDGVVQEIRKLVAVLAADSSAVMCPPQLFAFVQSVLDIQRVAGPEAVPNDVLRQNFFRLLDLGSPLLLHALLQIRLLHPSLFEDSDLVDDVHIMRKLLACAQDSSLAREQQCLAVRMLQEFGQLCGSYAYSVVWPELWPSVFDDYAVTAGKLRALVFAFDPPSRPSPQTLLSALTSLAEFRGRPPSHFLARAVFATLRLVLARLPEQFEAVYRFLLDLLVYSPQFLSNLTESLDLKSPVTEHLLTNFNQLLCGLECAKLRDYVPLAELVSRVASIDATLLLDRVLAFLSSSSFDAHLASLSVDERWTFGNALVDLYRSALIVQSPARLTVWEFVCRALSELSQRYPDVEIRDRAHFLHLLATHLEPPAVAELLASAESGTPLATRDAADLFAGASGPKIPAPVVLSRPFLCFDRVAATQSNGGESRWPWSEVASSEGADGAEAEGKMFLSGHPPPESEALSIALRLRFMSAAEMEQTSRAKGGEERKRSAGSKKKKKGSAGGGGGGVIGEEDPAVSCVLGATVSFAAHCNFTAGSSLDVAVLRAKETVDFALQLAVAVPLPGAVRSEAEFSFVPTVGSGGESVEEWRGCVVARAPLGKVRVELTDLFAELPDNVRGQATLPVARAMWCILWHKKEFAAADSVKRVAGRREAVERAVMASLRRHAVLWSGDVARFLIYLPPGSHVLLEARFGAESTLFRLKTDLWQLAESVELFLESFVANCVEIVGRPKGTK